MNYLYQGHCFDVQNLQICRQGSDKAVKCLALAFHGERYMAAMELQRTPLKLYIQDIFRADRTVENKYIYTIFGLKFKNIMIHGIVTAVYNNSGTSVNFELSDPTATVHVYYDSLKTNNRVPVNTLNNLYFDYAEASKFENDNVDIMGKMLNVMSKRTNNPVGVTVGQHVRVVGDVFVDDLRDIRMVSCYEYRSTSPEYDLVWLEELQYLYDKFYLWLKKESNNNVT